MRMRTMLTAGAAGATGYVLGARAGRQRYEQIKDHAQQVWRSDAVQDGVDEVKDRARYAADQTASGARQAAEDLDATRGGSS